MIGVRRDGLRTVSAALIEVAGLRLLLWLAVSTWFFADGLASPYHVGVAHDWQYFTQHANAAWRSWAVYHEIPLWEPWYCGGITAIGNLQNNAVSPSMLLTVFFGLMPGLRLAAFLAFVVGMEGTWRYVRLHGIHGIGALTAALCFALSGRFVRLFEDGQPIFLAFQLTPWALLCFEKALVDVRYIVAGAGVMGLLLLEGGAIPTPLVSIFLGLMAVWHTAEILVTRRPGARWWRPVVTLAAMAGLTLLLFAFRALPVAEEVFAHPRVWHSAGTYSIGHVINMLVFANGHLGYSGDGSSFCGHVTVVVFLLALVARDRRAFMPALVSLVLLDVCTGTDEFIGIFPAIKKLPVVENLRAPFRFTIFIAFLVACGAGAGISRLEHHILGYGERADVRQKLSHWSLDERRVRQLAATVAVLASGLVAVFCVADLTAFTRARLKGLFVSPAPATAEGPFRQSIGNRWAAAVWPAVNLGTIQCFEEQPFATSQRLRGDLPQQSYLGERDEGTVTPVSWSPHRVQLAVELNKAGTVFINQNAHQGWRSNVGRVAAVEGLLTVGLPAGRHDLVLTFVDPLFRAGSWLAAIGWLLALAWLWRRRRTQGVSAARARP